MEWILSLALGSGGSEPKDVKQKFFPYKTENIQKKKVSVLVYDSNVPGTRQIEVSGSKRRKTRD